MDVNDPKWVTVSDSEHSHEREALAWFRRALPNSPVTRAWSNFSFAGRDGRMYEVDLLLLTPAGFWLIEFKAHPGTISGDQSTWQWEPPNGGFKTFDNPRILANKKAKVLKGLIESTKAMRSASGIRAPFLQELVFLSDPGLTVRLSQQGRHAVFGRDAADGDEIPALRSKIGGVVAHVSSLEPDPSGRPKRRVDRPTSEAVAAAMEQIGIRELTSRRTVGDYRLLELLEDVDGSVDSGVTFQDFTARHASIDLIRRARVYPLEHNATDEAHSVARRAARREFELLTAIDHPGILRPVEYVDSDRGPTLLFDYDADAVPLHHWLDIPSVADDLTVEHRLGLLRQIAEAVHHAHQRGVSHRNLAPATILVGGLPGATSVKVTNWHAGARISQGTLASASMTRATEHGSALGTVDASFYRAPEYAQEGARSSLCDVFSLGAIAALVMTDSPPARSVAAFDKMILSTGYVDASAIGDNVDGDVVDLIAEATMADPGGRLPSVADFLVGIDLLEEDRRVTTDVGEISEPEILDAKKGDTVGGGRFEIVHRLGSGSTAIALEVLDTTNAGRRCVLKVASSPELNERLDEEASALESLRHPRIVELLSEPLSIDGHRVLVLSFAGQTTLAARLADQPGAELAQRFGHDLLDALQHLEERGVSHRDIKPENIGIVLTGARDELRALLFDFSLSRASLDALDAGTQGYVDPFLKTRGRWDLHADRYSAAVTLFEMATGTRPRYGDGSAHPATIEAGPTIEPTMFEPSAAKGLAAFFASALAREVGERFDTAAEMLRAWDRAFEVDSPSTDIEKEPENAARPPSAAKAPTLAETYEDIDEATEATTPLAALDVSRKAINACERISVTTAAELANTPRGTIRGLRGIGARTKRELLTLNGSLAAFFRANGTDLGSLPEELEPEIELTETPATTSTSAGSALVAAATRLLPAVDASETNRRTLEYVLDFPIDPEREPLVSRWPSQKEPAAEVGVTTGRVAQLLTEARQQWSANPMVETTAALIAEELSVRGGLASINQLTSTIARGEPQGPSGDAALHRRAAGALVRAALYAEKSAETPRWEVRRRDQFAVVASEAAEDSGAPSSQMLADYAVGLAQATDEAVEAAGVVDARQLATILHRIPRPTGTASFDDGHLVELATDISATAAVNARLEVYRSGMSARQALQACRRSFVGVNQVKPEEIADRVGTRFPEAELVPSRPELDRLLIDAGIDLQWSEEAFFFVRPPSDLSETGTATTFRRPESDVFGARPVSAQDVDSAKDFDSTLQSWLGDGSVRLLLTNPRDLKRSAEQLSQLEVTVLDFDELLLDRLISATASGKPSWDVVTRADAGGPSGNDWVKLQKLLGRELAGLTEDLFATEGTVVLHSLGLLARYDRVNQVAQWLEALHTRSGSLSGLWLLIPGGDDAAAPMLGNEAVPVVGPGYWRNIPREWLVTSATTRNER